MPDENELGDDIVGAVSYEPVHPTKKDFLPWHRPRKQYVRHYQWCSEIESLIADMRLDGNALRYLGLPGSDLLDLRYFHSTVCEPWQIALRFLGFNSDAGPKGEHQTELNISLDEVRKLPKIDPRSEIIWDDFRRIANVDSLAWRKAEDCGPYNIVNLDLCDGFCAQPPGLLDDTHYNAISRLLTLQARSRNPWLLLLTTRAGAPHTNADVLNKLLTKYLENLKTCPPFNDLSKTTLSVDDEASLRSSVNTPSGLLAIFLVGLCKWMLGLAIAQRPPSKLLVKSVLGYRVYGGAPNEDLISLALRFEPTFEPSPDPMGLANQPANMPDECELAVKLFEEINQRVNVDSLLDSDLDLREELINATSALLELARYDVSTFREWLNAV